MSPLLFNAKSEISLVFFWASSEKSRIGSLVEAEIQFCLVPLYQEPVDIAEIIFMEAHSFGLSVFDRLRRDFFRILLGSPENGRLPGPRQPSVHEARRLPSARKEPCFVNEKTFKTFEIE